MFSRNMVLQMAMSALVFFLVFRLLSFFGLGMVLLVGLGVGAWYLFAKRPDVIARWKSNLTSKVSTSRRSPSVAPPPPMQDRPLTHDERTAFNDLVRGYDSPRPEDRSPRE